MPVRVWYALFAAYVAATAVHIGFVMAHEPFAFDAWNVAFDTRSEPITLSRFFDYWSYEYTHSNPRLGQAFTYLAYKLDLFAVIVTPIAYLAITFAVTVLGLGRWPRAGRELALWAVAIGFGWFAFPELGRNMFNRAYGANYIYGAAIQLWFLVPLRLATTFDVSPRRALAYGVFGAVAGLCNEHTGPVLVALLVLLAWRHRGRLLYAGAAGFSLGFAAIFFAPGQSERYDSLVQKTGFFMRLVQRGVIGMVDIVGDYFLYAAPVLVLVVIVLVRAPESEARRTALRLVALALGLGVALAATLWVSPKLGARFYLLSCALLLAALIALVDATVTKRAALVTLAVAASTYAAIRTIPLYARVSAESDDRLAGLLATPPGGVYVADAFDQSDESWWFIGDDFDVPQKREHVAEYLGLSRVVFRGFDLHAPLGTTGVAVTARYTAAGDTCPSIDHELDLAGSGLDVPGIVTTTRDELASLRARKPITSYELVVEFPGTPPPMPRPRIVIARASAGDLDAHAGAIVRPGGSTTREVRPGDKRPLELYIWQVGGEFRRLDDSRRFTPWRSGIYWALGCDATECWVIAAVRAHAS